jgi:antirestriction protein ArdC
MNSAVISARETLANQIMSRLESGDALAWVRQWFAAEAPYNAVSRKNYRGINTLHLSFSKFDDPRWMTFNQASQAGYKVKKGSKASRVEFWQRFDEVDENGEKTGKTGMMCKLFSVFNAEQIDGIPPLTDETPRAIHTNDRAEKIAANCGCKISHGGSRAFYSPMCDSITVPHQKNFFSDAAYYQTLMHEIAHSTGHQSRLNRDLTGKFGKSSYAIEELRAEMGSAFICKDLGISLADDEMQFHIDQHAAYIEGWLSVLKGDRKKLLDAISDANKIANLVSSYEK